MNYCTTEPPTRPEKPQIFTSKEFAVGHAFSEANFADLKSMFEGDGAHLSVNKYIAYEKLFEGGFFIVASNEKPMISHVNHNRYAE